jgi:hypothetical protein
MLHVVVIEACNIFCIVFCQKIPGVVKVLTAADIPSKGVNTYLPGFPVPAEVIIIRLSQSP